MSESEIPTPEISTNQESQEKLRSPAEIIGDLLNAREKVAKGEEKPAFLHKAMFEAAKDMLANNKEAEALGLFTSAMNHETAIMGTDNASEDRLNINKMIGIANSNRESADSFADSAKQIGGSVNRMSMSVEDFGRAASRMQSR